MNPSTLIQNQLLATKFFVPITPGPLISRPRLTGLLDESLKYPLTLISAPAGFGKTTLLSAWKQSLRPSKSRVAWVSLDEEDNDPRQFWTYVLAALDMQQPERFTPLLKSLQSSQAPPLKYVLTSFINLLTERTNRLLLILDDYHLITEQEVHATLTYLVEHLPTQLHIILSTRADPPLPLLRLRTRRQVLEMRTDQLRCTTEETRAFFQEVIGIKLSNETIQEVTARTEGWLVGLQLLGLSLPEQVDPLTVLEDASGDQRYILDYLTEEVLRRQPEDMQLFLLSTSILERLTSSLCDAVMQQRGSQQMLERLEAANLFVVSLDRKRQWYRYHALFAQALYYRLEQTYADLVRILHHRASLWYAEHDQITQAILHALRAKEWLLVADLIEQQPLMSFTWGANEQELVLLRRWLEFLPAEVMGSRPRLCLACAQLLWQVAPYSILESWFRAAEATLTTSLTGQTHQDASPTTPASEVQQEQENLLGEVLATRAYVQSHWKDGSAVLALCQQAFALVSPDNYFARIVVSWAQMLTYYASAINDVEAAIESGLQGVCFAQAAQKPALVISTMCATARHVIGAGRLQQTYQLTQQAMLVGTQPEGLMLAEVSWPLLLQAEILREWNQLDTAQDLAAEAISLCKQTKSLSSLLYLLLGYAVLLRICLSRGELEAAHTALQQFEHLGRRMSQPSYIFHRSYFTTIDQVRLWLACGELDRATRWADELDVAERHVNPFACEREEVARVRVLLAKSQPNVALQRLEPVLQRTTMGKRWGHVIEIRLLQTLAYHMCNQQMQACSTLSEAVRLAEPEGYIRSFVDEGQPMATLLCRLREELRKDGPTPYLDSVLAAFPQQSSVLLEPYRNTCR